MAVVAGVHLEAFLAQPTGQQVAEFLVVVDQQQFAHGGAVLESWDGYGNTWLNGLTSAPAYTPAAW